ncbi:MAG TPA: LPS export ABC transporter ATP-binding protein [Nitrospiria bacterium]|nr:LPS export ABC transporter ATP-binding protein [Nitrospiria bacterium]
MPGDPVLTLTNGDASPDALSAVGLEKTFRRRRVVKGVSVTIKPGEVVGLLGPNGAGKTTVFNMIVGVIAPDRGNILLNGRSITALPMHQRARLGVSYLPQEASVFRKLSVADNVMAILETLPLTREQRQARLQELLEELGVAHLADQKGYTLSGGERRRVEIARALVLSPKFVLLDEPFAGIDPLAVIDVQKVVAHLRSLGIGVLITDHNVRETLEITQRAYIINNGEILQEGTPVDIASSPVVRSLYLGEHFTWQRSAPAQETTR